MRLWPLLLLAALFACSDDDPSPAQVCAPGKQEACACPGGGQGAQVCNAEGTGYGACSPCNANAAGSGGAAGAPACKGRGDSCFDPDVCCDGLYCTVDKNCGLK